MDRRIQPARVLAVLYFSGASLGLLSIALPHPDNREALLATMVAFAYIGGIGLALAGTRLGMSAIHALAATGVLLIGGAIYAAGAAGVLYGSMFVWLAVYAGLFFSRPAALAHMALMGAVNGVDQSLVANPTGFSPVTRWLLSTIALFVVGLVTNWIAADRDRLDEELQGLLAVVAGQAHTDPLTGLPNRRAWDDTLARELARAERDERPLCVAVLDVDCLKEVNDRAGHAAGDAILVGAAKGWGSVLRAADYLARYGGDEFAILLPDCGLNEARAVIDRLRRAAPIGQTYSAGLAEWDRTETGAELLHRADGGLYLAKAGGRDRLWAVAV